MENKRANLINLENVKIILKNFSGRESTYNAAGARNFCVIIDDELAQKLAAEGWNVRHTKTTDDDGKPAQYIQVHVKYDRIPPSVYVLTEKGKTRLTEETVHQLDFVSIVSADVSIRGSRWEAAGKSGVKAYLKSMYLTIEEDAFASKYADYDEDEDYVPF